MRLAVWIIGFVTNCALRLHALTPADLMQGATSGDYIVTRQENNYSLLLLRQKDTRSITFEEVTIPCDKIYLPGMDWKDWMALGAPGHVAWMQYEIDPVTSESIEIYSPSKRAWIRAEGNYRFFSRLLSLPLKVIPESEQRKIGSAPARGEEDRRPVWAPTLVFEGEKKKVPCKAYEGRWPEDGSALSSCRIVAYFPRSGISFFPLAIEADNGHITYSIRTIETGSKLSSPVRESVPKRPIRITLISEKQTKDCLLQVCSPKYYTDFSLFAFDITRPDVVFGPVPFRLETKEDPEMFTVRIARKDLCTYLPKKGRYRWVLQTEKKFPCRSESEDFFLWNP